MMMLKMYSCLGHYNMFVFYLVFTRFDFQAAGFEDSAKVILVFDTLIFCISSKRVCEVLYALLWRNCYYSPHFL